MKKQILILSVVAVSMVLFSCSKEKLDMPTNEQTNNEEMVAPNRPAIDPLSVKLEGWYTFDRTLKDQAQKLPNAIHQVSQFLMIPTERANQAGYLFYR